MKSEQIIIIGVVIASMLFAYLLNGNIREGITNNPDYSNMLMVSEQIKKLKNASSLIKNNKKIKNKIKMIRNLDATHNQLNSWYKDRINGLTDPTKKTSVKKIKNIWSKNRVLVASSVFDDLDVLDDDQTRISRILKQVTKNMDSIE